jgi:hypothetical protein
MRLLTGQGAAPTQPVKRFQAGSSGRIRASSPSCRMNVSSKRLRSRFERVAQAVEQLTFNQ